MRLNQFIFFLASTVFLGALIGVVTVLSGMWINVQWFTGLIEGGFLATTSLMGFWAFLMLNFIARVTIPRRVWRWMQLLILVVVLYDMFWSRYHIDVARHPHQHPAYGIFFLQALWPLVVALIAAYFKRKLSGKGSFLPTVFYLYVFTVVDWLLVIRSHWNPGIVNQTGIVMMACNVYMILIFGKLLSPPSAQYAVSDSEDVDGQDASAESDRPGPSNPRRTPQ